MIPALLGFGLAAAGWFHLAQAALLEHRQTGLLIQARQQAAYLDARVSAVEAIAHSTAGLLTAVPGLTDDELYALATSGLEQDPLLRAATIALAPSVRPGRPGLFAAAAFRSKEGGSERLDLATRYDYTSPGAAWFTQARDPGGAGWMAPWVEPGLEPTPVARYTVPLLVEGRFLGVVAIDLDLTRLQGLADQSASQRFVLLGSSGDFLSHPDPTLIGQETLQEMALRLRWLGLARLWEGLRAGQEGMSRLERFATPEPHWVFYAPLPKIGWMYAVAVPESLLMAAVRAPLLSGIIALAALFVVVAFSSLFTSYRFGRPLERMAETVHTFQNGRYWRNAEVRFGKDEIGRIGGAIYGMGTDLEALALELEVSRDHASARLSEERGRLAADLDAERRTGAQASEESRLLKDLSVRAQAESLAARREADLLRQALGETEDALRSARAEAEGLAEARSLLASRELAWRAAEEALHGQLAVLLHEQSQLLVEREGQLAALRAEIEARNALEGALRTSGSVAQRMLQKVLPRTIRREDVTVSGHILGDALRGGAFLDILEPVPEELLVYWGGPVKAGPAAAVMSLSITEVIRRTMDASLSAEALLERLNESLRSEDGTLAVEFFLLRYRVMTGEFTYLNAGHPPPWIRDEGARFHPYASTCGMPLGLTDAPAPAHGIGVLAPGQILVGYTSGVAGLLSALEGAGTGEPESLPGQAQLPSPRELLERMEKARALQQDGAGGAVVILQRVAEASPAVDATATATHGKTLLRSLIRRVVS